MMQLLPDTDPELDSSQADSIIFTPVASDSDFDELLESDSLGDRSTTSTVPTQNFSQNSQSSTTSYYGVRKITEGSRRDMMEGYSKDTSFQLKILLWASIPLSVITTLLAMGWYLDPPSFYQYGCQLYSEDPAWGTTSKDYTAPYGPSPVCFTNPGLRLLRKRKILSKTICPSYYSSLNTNTWMSGQDRVQWPEYPIQIWLVYIYSFRSILYYGGLIFGAIILFDVAFLGTLSRLAKKKWTIRNSALRDLEPIALVAFVGSTPWESILPYFFGVTSIIDNVDRKDISFAVQYFIASWVCLRRLTVEKRGDSLFWKGFWLLYSASCVVALGLTVYMYIARGREFDMAKFKLEVKPE
ncbi:hypothetical protein TWF730_001453 [Orbilia blumenaviensis]|uniref:Uncharacterized protein n=1 Tax=Orbilia blumenaviensis TaxID=1796055 RepID=A0AAV9UM74_9PEZI